MKEKDIIEKLDTILKNCCYTKTVPVKIYGKLYHFDEEHLRALQVLMHDADQDEFVEYANNITVYSNTKISNSNYTMEFRRDGRFVDEFECGIFSTNADLTFHIL